MEDYKDDLDRAIKKAAASIINYSIAKKDVRIPASIVDAVSKAIVEGADNLMNNMPAARNFNDLHRAVRILAITTCPAPEKHEAVIRCCFKPLGEPIVGKAAEEKLKAAMPEWMN